MAKRVTDPVHGTIALTQAEVDVMSTATFQRLRNVKQLGLAHYVFPGADYSRFSHSLGACHVAGRMLTALSEHGGATIGEPERQKIRLAALLHDVGHYPFSHAMEDATANYYARTLVEPTVGPGQAPSNGVIKRSYLTHEELGKQILVNDQELSSALSRHGFSPEDIYKVFRREDGSPYANLISSDLDADRIDYLMRTARHTGLPYGSVDVNYLLDQLALADDHICVRRRALRTVDHFLLCRYFDYQQVAYHKTVVGFEWLLKDVLATLIEGGQLACSRDDMIEKIRSGTWGQFGDPEIFGMMRQLSVEATSPVARLQAGALVARRPPKLLFSTERLADESVRGTFELGKHVLDEKVSKWASKWGIDPSLWHVWSNRMSLTKMGTSLPLTKSVDQSDRDEERLAQAVWVLGANKAIPRPIMDDPRSLMHTLADSGWWALRLYVLAPHDKVSSLSAIRDEILQEIPESLHDE